MRFRLIPLLLILLRTSDLLAQAGTGYSRASIVLEGTTDGIRTLQALGIDLDHADIRPGQRISGDLSERDLDLARQAGFEVQVEIADVSAFYAERGALPAGKAKDFGDPGCPGSDLHPQPQNFVLGSMAGYYTWQEMQDQLDAMVALFPNLISPKVSIGTSHEGRPIHFVRISNNPNVDQAKPEVLYDALHHAREPESAMQLYYYMWYLLENYGTDPLCTHILDTRELYFVPCVNPDGYVYNETTDPGGGGMWRKNRRDNGDGTFGVDLNRNYGFQWGIDDFGSSPDPFSDVYRGPAPFSEPEIVAMRDFIEGKEFGTRHSHHCRGHFLLYPWGHVNDLCPDSSVFSTYAQRMTEDNGFHFGTTYEALFYVANGSATDWSYGEQTTKPKIFSYVPETGTYLDGFWPMQDRIVPLAEANLEENLLLALFAGPYAEAKDVAPRVVNSTTPNATFTLQSLGLQSGTFTVSVEPLTNVIAATGQQTFTGMDTLETITASIGLTLDPLITDGEKFSYVLVLDANNLILRDTIEKVYGEPLVAFSDNTANDNNWNGDWSLTTEDWYSAPSSFTDSPLSDYFDWEDKTWSLDGPVNLTLATTATLNFMSRWTVQSELDLVQLEASSDGASWTTLCGRYSRPGSVDQGVDEPVWDGKRTDWVQEEVVLDDLVGGPLYLRFRLSSEGGVVYDGFYVDDVAVTITGETISGVQELTVGNSQLGHYPDPAFGTVSFTYALPEGVDRGTLVLLNAQGAVVRREGLTSPAGTLQVDVSGFSPGLYCYTVEATGADIPMNKLLVLGQ